MFLILFLLSNACVKDPEIPDNIIGGKIPDVTTSEQYTVSASSIKISGSVIRANGLNIEGFGFVWWKESSPDKRDSCLASSGDMSEFSHTIQNLTNNTKYIISSYAENSLGIGYGNRISFTTELGIPQILTLEDNISTGSSLTVKGKLTHFGEGDLHSCGFHYSESPLTTENKGDYMEGVLNDSIFTVIIPQLKASTKYYLQSYAENKFGSVTGSQIELETLDGLLNINFFNTVAIGYTDALFTAVVSGEEEYPVLQKGFCYSSGDGQPTIDSDTIDCGTGFGQFEGTIGNLLSHTTYHIRAFATNENGTVYSENTLSIITQNELPTISTTPIKEVGAGSILVGMEILSTGTSEIITSGICWSNKPNPSISDSRFLEMHIDEGIGTKDSLLTGIRGGMTYYFRSYALNSNGYQYGNECVYNAPPIFKELACEFTGSVNIAGSASYFSIDDKGYILGGDKNNGYTNELLEFAPSYIKWVSKSPLTYKDQDNILWDINRAWMIAAGTETGIVAFGGKDEQKRLHNDLYTYNIFSNEWRKGEHFGDIPVPMSNAACCYSGNYFYVVGGIYEDTDTKSEKIANSVYLLSPLNLEWKKIGNTFPEKQYNGVIHFYNGVIYAGLGLNSLGLYPNSNNHFYKSEDGGYTWIQLDDMPASTASSSVLLNNKIYIVDQNGTFLEFDTDTEKWSKKSNLPDTYKSVRSIFTIEEMIYICPGKSNLKMINYDPRWDNMIE